MSPRHFTRKLPAAEASVFLDELYLNTGLKPQPFPSGAIIISPSGEPMIRVLELTSGHVLFYFSTDFYKEPKNGITKR